MQEQIPNRTRAKWLIEESHFSKRYLAQAGVIAFIAAQIGVPIVATLHRWITGKDSWWGWQMFSS